MATQENVRSSMQDSSVSKTNGENPVEHSVLPDLLPPRQDTGMTIEAHAQIHVVHGKGSMTGSIEEPSAELQKPYVSIIGNEANDGQPADLARPPKRQGRQFNQSPLNNRSNSK
jgi:hypothetical protein